jgi:hypothetical protein
MYLFSSYTGYIMQTAKWAIVKYMCRAYTFKRYVICEMYLFSHTDYIMKNSHMGYRSIYTELYTKMLCNVRDVPVFSHTDYIMQTAKTGYWLNVQSHTLKRYHITKQLCNTRDVPVFIQTTPRKQLIHAKYICWNLCRVKYKWNVCNIQM